MRLFILILTLFSLAGCMMPMHSNQPTKLANEKLLQHKAKTQSIRRKCASPMTSNHVPIVNLMANKGGRNA